MPRRPSPKKTSAPFRPSAKQTRTARFVAAARQLALEQGLGSLSVRKIAERAGYHNSTIYTYFKDEERLLSLACVPFFADYTRELARLRRSDLSVYDGFFAVWAYFCDSAFQQPDVFRLFFFGRYSGDLPELLDRYFELFPEEKDAYAPVLDEMYCGANFEERCLRLTSPMVQEEKTRLTGENLPMVNSIIASVFRSLLQRRCADQSLDSAELTAWFLQSLHYLVDL